MSAIEAPPAVRWITRTLEEAGHETWAVGGAIRDVLLGIESTDWDLATGARPGEIRRLFPRTVPIGVEHGTVGVLARDGTLYEVTTFRKDVETDGRHAVVEFADRIEDDLARRDFTVNALAWHPLRGELTDPFGGAEDLDSGILRTVGRPGDRFQEDYLRVLRALRFAGRFELTVEEPTWRALSAVVDRLPGLSPERIREELVKVLASDPRPSRSLALYAASGALDVLYPELAGLVGTHPRAVGEEPGPDGWSLALLSADALPAHRPLLRLAALLLDAKPDGDPVAELGPAGARPGGEDGSARDAAALAAAAVMTRLRFSNADTDRVVGIVRAGGEPPPAEGDPADRRRWLSTTGPERVPDVLRVSGARARIEEAAGRSGTVESLVSATRAIRKELRAAPPLDVGELALDGRDLIRMGLTPGPRFGEILSALLERVLEEPSSNRREELEALVREEIAPEFFGGEGA